MPAKKPSKIPAKPPLGPAYEPKSIESTHYKSWEKSGFFNPDKLPNGKKRKPFTIVLPPPNATGTLHVGHAVMHALQDIVIRFKRMSGFAALWVPGTDHAAIATQAKVEKILLSEGKSRQELGRAKFLKRVESFVADSQSTIRNQMRVMGSSCDWSRECYTLDEPRSAAVRKMFVQMYNDGLVYRGERIVNWCPRCASTLADDEVEYQEEKTPLYYFKYGPITISTARPETKFLDKTIVVNPKDVRYKNLIGKSFDVEWIDGTVKANVIGDPTMDMNFGTGAMTITPAHDFHDFELAKQHGLPVVKIIDEQGNFTKAAGKFAGKNARASREEIVAMLEKKGLVEKIDRDYVHNVAVHGINTCRTVIEPLPSLQWFIGVNKKISGRGKSLKDLSLEVVKKKKITILPDRFENVYYHWMENLRDWCISRQIWFGHRIPAWYCNACDEVMVAEKEPKKCTNCKSIKLRQDSDTFDTWFSSGTWTFSTLGWPKQTSDLKRFHPTQLLETGYDIIFFWVARMILMTTYAMKQIPFEKVYLHGLVRDEQGRKMSKSLGNIIDPLDVSAKYGTDAVRLSLIIGTTPGNDTRLSEEKIAYFRNFTNKLWNLSRFVAMTCDAKQSDRPQGASDSWRTAKRPNPKTISDKWVLTRLDQIITSVTTDLNAYNFSRAGETLRDFTWNEVADWYLEIAKIEKGKEKILAYILHTLLSLWHPFMPFVTEEIYKLIFAKGAKDFLMIAKWPKSSKPNASAKRTLADFTVIQELVTAIRNLRAQYNVPPSKLVDAIVFTGKHSALFKANSAIISGLGRIQSLTGKNSGTKPSNAATAIVASMTVCIPLEGLVDTEKEKQRLDTEIAEAKRYLVSLETKLQNKDFVERAPAPVITKEREKVTAQQDKIKELESQREVLK